MISSNQTRQASETHGCIDRNEAAFLFTVHRTDCRCDVRNSSKAEQTSKGTPPPSVLIRRQPSTRHFRQVNQYQAHTSVRQWLHALCVLRGACTYVTFTTDFAVFNYRICMALNKVVKTVHYFWVCHQMRRHRTPLVFQSRCRIRSWTISVSYRDRLRAKNRHVGIGWKWCTRSNTIRNACNMDSWKVTLCCLCSICHRASIDANSLLIITRHAIIRPRLCSLTPN